MIRVREGGLMRYQFETFRRDGLIHGVFTRLGGFSSATFHSLNLCRVVRDDPAVVAANHEAMYRVLGVEDASVVSARQVHGDKVAYVSSDDGGTTYDETDALVSDAPGRLLLLRFADCVPVLLYAPRQGAVGLAHAGWQGTVKGIAAKTARAMMWAYGCKPEDLYAGLGPAIGPCCYEVGTDVIEPLCATFGTFYELISRPGPPGKAYVDLWRANALQLEWIGVRHIEVGDICTCCHRDEFFSHRGENGRTGRFGAVIGLRADAHRPQPHDTEGAA